MVDADDSAVGTESNTFSTSSVSLRQLSLSWFIS